MHRTTVFLTAQQLRGLKDVGQVSHLSMSSLLRMFVTEGIARRKRTQAAPGILPGRKGRKAVLVGE
jgi:hypothetical protein